MPQGWGDDSNDYTVMTADTDKFVFENPDFLVLFAAGNDGDGMIFRPSQTSPHHTGITYRGYDVSLLGPAPSFRYSQNVQTEDLALLLQKRCVRRIKYPGIII